MRTCGWPILMTRVRRINSSGLQMIVPDVAHCAAHQQPAAVTTMFATAAPSSGARQSFSAPTRSLKRATKKAVEQRRAFLD